MKVHVAKKELLNDLLEPEHSKINMEKAPEIDLSKTFKEILRSANEFVPSESGSIFLNNSFLRDTNPSDKLFFVACFGKGSAKLTGESIPMDIGIIGETFQTGKPYISKAATKDTHFFADMDKKTKFETKSIICAPIEIKGTRIGVIELINKLDNINYIEKDLTLLKIFAGYTSTLIQNALDAKRFQDFSIHDSLTGLYNDRYFFDRIPKDIKATMRTKKDLCLIFLDIDNLKEINDVHGHLAGNRVLDQIGEILASNIPTKTTTIARYGGDEFVIIVPGYDLTETIEYSEDLRVQIENDVVLRQRENITSVPRAFNKVVTASIGIASLKRNVALNMSIENIVKTLIKQSDTAMYNSKKAGKNTISIADGKLSLAT